MLRSLLSVVNVLLVLPSLFAEVAPQAEKGDALFRDATISGHYFSHAAIYYGYYQFVWDGQFHDSVIQAHSDQSPAVKYATFDYVALDQSYPYVSFMDGEPSSAYFMTGLGPRNCSNLSPPTWKNGMSNSMSPALRDAIVSEAITLVGKGLSYFLLTLWNNSCDPRNPSSTGYPTTMRCDGVVVWVYESVGFNTGDRSGITTPKERAPRWKAAVVDTPTTALQDNGATYTITVADNSSTPTFVRLFYPGASTIVTKNSPDTETKTRFGTTYYQGVDFAGHGGTTNSITYWQVIASAGSFGSIIPSGPVPVNQGTNQAFSATPNNGYVVDQWQVDGSVVQTGGNRYSFPNIQTNHSIQVTFAHVSSQSTITVQANPVNGGTVSGGGTYPVGTNVQISASGNNGWTFASWSDGGAQSHNIIVPGTNITYTANFANCSYTLTTVSTNVTASAGNGNVGLTAGAGCAWTATSNTNWIHTASSGIGNGPVSYTFDTNSAGTARSGTLTVNGQTFTVNQAAATCTYEFPSSHAAKFFAASTNVNATAGTGGAVPVYTQAGCSWTATSNTNWLHTTSSGTGNGSVNYTFDANSAGIARSGTITVNGQTLTVNQTGGACTYALSAATTNIAASAGSGRGFWVTTLAGCSWTATSNTNWIHTASSGTGNGLVSFTYDANPSGTARNGTITVNGQTYAVNQVGSVSNGPPVIVEGPTVTNALLTLTSGQIVVAGDTNIFTVGAIDSGGNPLSYRWQFGDGVTNGLSAVGTAAHVYSETNNCGPYQVSVTVSNHTAAVSSNLTVIVACDFLAITKLQVGVNFAKLNADSISLKAKVGLPGLTNIGQLAGFPVVVNVGGVQVPFTLNNKGRGVGANGTSVLAYTKPTKQLPGYWTATITLSKGNWHNQWVPYGLENTAHKSPGVVVTLPVIVLIGNEAFTAEPQLHYTATQNKTGIAK